MSQQASLFEVPRLETMESLRARVADLETLLEYLPQSKGHLGFDFCRRTPTGSMPCECGHVAIARTLGREPRL